MEGATRTETFMPTLTRLNGPGKPLLKTIGKGEVPAHSSQHQPVCSSTMSDSDADVMRLPESSEDEQELVDAKPTSTRVHSTSAPSPKRKREPARPTRASKRPRLQNDAGIDALPAKTQDPPVSSQHTPMADALFSQPSQKKRPTFANRHKSQVGMEGVGRGRSAAKAAGIDLTDVKERDTSPPKKARAFAGDDAFVHEEEHVSTKPLTLVSLADEEEVDSSNSTSATQLHTFEGTPEPDTRSKHSSSPPTSPEVVDVDDIAEEVTKREEVSATVTCPVCREEVDRSSLASAENAPRLFSLKKQQEFCRSHRFHKAESVRKERNYPMIDWQVLSLERIPKHIPHLQQVLRREAKCYYLDQLEAKVTKAKGNRKAIRQYLTEEVLDIAKAGYYGPKGIGIMMDSVTSELSKDLTEMLTDKFVRSAGMGGFVTAVLVPELTLRLVMDDMNIHDEALARKVLDDSTEIGLLLNADDDHIEHRLLE